MDQRHIVDGRLVIFRVLFAYIRVRVFCGNPRNPPKFSYKINAFAGVFFVCACKRLIYSEKKFSFLVYKTYII